MAYSRSKDYSNAMNITPVLFAGIRLLLVGTLAVSLLGPAAGFAQQAQPQSGTVTGSDSAPSTQGAPGAQGGHGHGMGFMRAMNGITLSDAQKQQIQQLQGQFQQTHPQGSAPDPQARKQLRQSVLNVLTPDQRTQFQKNMAQMRAAFQAHRAANGDNGGNEQPSNGGPGGGPFAPDASPSPAPSR
jgi:Spy/CpxP family protein refolding chaperone